MAVFFENSADALRYVVISEELHRSDDLKQIVRVAV